MEYPEANYRRIGLGAGAVFALLATVTVVSTIGRPKTAFEGEQRHAQAMNPKCVSVEITTADNRHEYRQSEPIFVVAHFSSTKRGIYKIEVAEGWSLSAVDFLHFSNGQRTPLNRMGVICCDSRLIGLDEPSSPRTLTPLQLVPGDYEVYLTSRRVFESGAGPKEYEASFFQVASNLLKIRVVPNAVKVSGDPK